MGQVLISRAAGQAVVVELSKAPGKKLRLALPRGLYVATVRPAGDRRTVRCQLRLAAHSRVTLNTAAPTCAPVRQPEVSVRGTGEQGPRPLPWGLELGVGLMLRGHDDYTERLEQFGFEGDSFTGNKAPMFSAALSYAFDPYLSLVLGYGSLELFEARRKLHDLQNNAHTRTFDWWAHGIGLSLRGTLPLAGGVFNHYLQAGGGGLRLFGPGPLKRPPGSGDQVPWNIHRQRPTPRGPADPDAASEFGAPCDTRFEKQGPDEGRRCRRPEEEGDPPRRRRPGLVGAGCQRLEASRQMAARAHEDEVF